MFKEVEGMGRSRTVTGSESARTEGARRATGVRAAAAAVEREPQARRYAATATLQVARRGVE